MLTSHSIGSFSEYTAIEGWFFVGSIYAEDYHNNSECKSKTDGNHADDLICFQLI